MSLNGYCLLCFYYSSKLRSLDFFLIWYQLTAEFVKMLTSLLSTFKVGSDTKFRDTYDRLLTLTEDYDYGEMHNYVDGIVNFEQNIYYYS